MLSKHDRTLDNASPSTSKSSSVAYRRTSIPSIIPVSVAASFSASISSPHRAPLAPLDPQLPFKNPPDDQMSPSSSTSSNSHLSYPLPDSQKDGDRAQELARSYIGRHIISRTQEEDPDQALQSARKRSVPGLGNTVRSLPYPHPRSIQQRRPSNTPPTSNSRRPSVPGTQYSQATSQIYPDLSSSSSTPNTASFLETALQTNPAYLNSEDLYSGLSTFTFGAARPLPSPQGSDSSEMVSPLTRVPPASSADRTPRPSIASSNGSARRVRALKISDPDEGDDEYDEDEDDAARGKTRSKMRAIDDGSRRPSLPTNALPSMVSDQVPPPLPSHPTHQGHTEMSPDASSGQESGFEDSEADEGETAEFDTDVEFELHAHGENADPPISDAASQRTFGIGVYRHYGAPQPRNPMSMHDADDDNDSASMSPVTFSRDHDVEHDDVDVLDDPESPVGTAMPPPITARKGSLPWDIPSSSRSREGPSSYTITGRDREDSTATVTARRASRSVDDNLGSTALDSNVQSTSHPETRADFRSIEAQHGSQVPRTIVEESQGTSVQEQEFQYGDFDLDYILGSEGRKSWSSDHPSYIDPRNRKEGGVASGIAAEWEAGWSSARRPSTVTVGSGDDAFTRQVRHWDEFYAERRVDWSFKRESTDGRGPHRLSVASSAPLPDTKSHHHNTMLPGAQELWRQAYVGRFKVDRIRVSSDQSGKPPQQRLNIRHIPDPYSKGNTRGGPGVVIHKHSRAIAFSVFRNHGLFGRHYRQHKPTMTTSTSILLATKKVQEQYTSTRTTSKLNSHGLLEDVARHGDGSTLYSQSGTVVASSSARSRPPTPSGSQAGGNDTNRRRGRNEEAGPSDTDYEMRRISVSPPPPPPLPKEVPAHRRALSVSTSDISDIRSSDDMHGSHSADAMQHSASTEHSSTIFSFSNTSRSLSNHGDAMEIEDDEQSPPRTSHAEAFATVDSTYLEHMRNRSEPRHVEDTSSHGLLGAVRRRLLGQGGSKSQNAAPATAPRESNYQPPWLTMAPRSKQEERERVIQNLNESFKDVGLLPTVRPGKSSSAKGKRRKHPAVATNIFEQVPADSLYMLLPLWPGETDPTSSELREDPNTYVVRLEERQFLLVYYVPFDADARKRDDSGKKRTRTEPRASSHTSRSNGDRLISLQSFRVCARLVSYADLRETGVRVPACGLSITGSLTEAVQYLPPPSIREERLDDVVIGVCNARSSGMEFLPEGLKKLGLCMPTETPAPPISEMEQVPEEVVTLTPIGRAAVEMAWLGCMAVTSFGSL